MALHNGAPPARPRPAIWPPAPFAFERLQRKPSGARCAIGSAGRKASHGGRVGGASEREQQIPMGGPRRLDWRLASSLAWLPREAPAAPSRQPAGGRGDGRGWRRQWRPRRRHQNRPWA